MNKHHVEEIACVTTSCKDAVRSQAVSLLSSLNWSSQSLECFACVTLIVDHLLVQPLDAHNESKLNLGNTIAACEGEH